MESGPIRVLLIEDDEDDYILTRDLLAEARGAEYALDWVRDFDQGLAGLCAPAHDVCLLDYRLGHHNGLDLLRAAELRGPHAPVILLTGMSGREVDVEAMRAGAADFLVKGRIDAPALERSVRYAIERQRDRDALRHANDELERRVRERTTELERAKEEAEAANHAKDQFLAVLSHELRTPLNPVLLATTAMLDHRTPADELRPMLEMIRQNVTLQARLIDDLLDVMRIVRGKMTLHLDTADCHQLIHQATEISRSEALGRSHRLVLDLAAAEHHVNADSARLQQVFWNLLKNAIKFTPEGGTITVRTRNEAERIVVEFADTGIGIEPGAIPQIFDAFQQGGERITRTFGGLGLGLAICRGIIEAHGATITATSGGRGLGTTFRVSMRTVPVSTGASDGAPAGAGALATRDGLARLRILAVEDEPTTLRLMARLLEDMGHHVVTASSVADAWEEFQRDDGVDLIVSDIGLPDGTGLDLMRRVSSVRRVPAIALTGYGMDQDVVRSREAGFTTHITKPIDFMKLEAVIRQVVS